MAKGIHLFPFRTEKLSPLAPMVLPTGGRVGRCRIQMERVTEMWLSLFFVLSFVSRLILSYLILSYLILSRLVCCVRVVFSFLWCGALVFLFLCFLLFSPWLCFFFFAVFSSAFFALSVALFLRYSIFFFCPFCSFSALLWSLLSACLACFCLPDLSFSLFIFFFCTCVCWIRFGYLLLNLFCFDIKL